jgi:hypothetical protein
MARSSWIPLAIGGVGSVLLISGIQGEGLASVLKGEFGLEKGKPFPNPGAEPGSFSGTGQTSNVSFSPSTGVSPSIGGPVESVPNRGRLAPPPGANLLREQKEHELERFEKRKLTQKEKMEFLLLEQRHEL